MIDDAAIEWEQKLLGGLLCDSSKFDAVLDKLCVHDFLEEQHQMIFTMMLKLDLDRGYFDIQMICDLLSANECIFADYIKQLAKKCILSANTLYYANIVRAFSVERQLKGIASGINIADLVCSKHIDEMANKVIYKSESKPFHNDFREHLAEYLEETADELRSMHANQGYMFNLISEMNIVLVRYLDELSEQDD
ncbi:MAG TPA: DnaB-like helicase N-terminal domain-containing protein [Saprospiraceae bacterium]|nr:DnaB-like helicase N-terminal domain-containing protein [Saprospiraceae bacterium]